MVNGLTAPFVGVIIGGFVMSALGGYNDPRAFTYCCVHLFFGIFAAIPIPFTDSKWIVYICVWLLFFVGGFIFPTLTGIMLNSIPERLKTTANSIATLSYNLFGFLPAPFIYGLISSSGPDIQYWGRAAMGSIIAGCPFAVAALWAAYFF